MRFFRRSLVGLFLFAATMGLLTLAGHQVYSSLQASWAQDQRQRPARERIFSVNVIPFAPDEITPVLTSFGEVRSRRTLELRAPVGGTIVELAPGFEEGGEVRQGQLLAQLDPADAQTAVDVARTDLREAEADLREAERSLLLARDELVAAQNQASLQTKALTRQSDLRERGVGTEAAVEAAELAVSTSEQAVLSRRQAVQQAEARLDQIGTLIARRKINLADAERQLADTRVFAKFDGRLFDVSVTAGGLVSNNERLAELVDPDALEVSFRVSTAQYTRLLDADRNLIEAPVSVTLDVLGTNLTVAARLTRESAAVSEGTTGRLLFAEIDTPGGLRPGDFVTVTIEEPVLDGVVLVPATALSSTQSVLVLGEGDRLEEAQVQLLRRQGDDAIVRASALAGREIVAERSQLLGEGIKVKPLRAQGGGVPDEPEMVELDAERRAAMIAYIENNGFIPQEAKARMLTRLKEPKVPARMVARIESRMGS
ncbi:MAG: HlyD family efflux transporter periplasmic adaptor subunit [Paracoccaceae bacterium]